MRMLVSVEFADAGTMTGKHPVLVVGGCSDTTEPGDISISLEEAKTLLSAAVRIRRCTGSGNHGGGAWMRSVWRSPAN
jgi:hypothetical protein